MRSLRMNVLAAAYTAVLAAAAVMPAGCANYTTPVRPPPDMTPDQRNFQAVWLASQEILRDYYFTLDRLDRRAGVITTLPMTGKQWFEWWRHDCITTLDIRESSLQKVYRTVKVSIRPVSSNAAVYSAKVEVSVYRSELPRPEINSVNEAFNLFVLPTGDERRFRRQLLDYGRDELGQLTSKQNWVEYVAADPVLEKRMEAEIEVKTAKLLGGTQ